MWKGSRNGGDFSERTTGDRVHLRRVPCAVSRSRAGARNGNQPVKQGQAAELSYETKVFAAAHLNIPAGCCMVITQYGKTIRYISSGEPVLYPTHQEILVVREDYA